MKATTITMQIVKNLGGNYEDVKVGSNLHFNRDGSGLY